MWDIITLVAKLVLGYYFIKFVVNHPFAIACCAVIVACWVVFPIAIVAIVLM